MWCASLWVEQFTRKKNNITQATTQQATVAWRRAPDVVHLYGWCVVSGVGSDGQRFHSTAEWTYSEVFCVHPPSRSRLLLLAEREIWNKKICKTTRGIRTRVHFDNNRDLLARQQFPEATLSVNLSLSFLPFVSPLFALPPMRVPFLHGWSQDDELHTLGLVASMKMTMMVVGVLNFPVPQKVLRPVKT